MACLTGKGFFAKNTGQSISVESINKMQEAMKTVEMFFHLSSFAEQHLPADRQPFILLKDEKDQPLIACMLEGNFQNMEKKSSGHIPEFHAYESIRSSVEGWADLCDGDLTKLFAYLQKEKAQRELRTFADRGTVILLGADGSKAGVNENGLMRNFDWGFSTNLMETTPPPKVEEPKKEDDPFSVFNTIGEEAKPVQKEQDKPSSVPAKIS